MRIFKHMTPLQKKLKAWLLWELAALAVVTVVYLLT
jgi:hypothetical protein